MQFVTKKAKFIDAHPVACAGEVRISGQWMVAIWRKVTVHKREGFTVRRCLASSRTHTR